MRWSVTMKIIPLLYKTTKTKAVVYKPLYVPPVVGTSSFCNCINWYGFLINDGMVLFPLFRHEHRSFWRELPDRGAAGMPLVFGGLRIALPKTLAKSEKRRIKAASGLPFLWILSFGNAKESIAVVGPRTDIKISVAIATQPIYPA
jgi:hypothetical protein